MKDIRSQYLKFWIRIINDILENLNLDVDVNVLLIMRVSLKTQIL